jgi:hypothetical protein
MNRQDQLRHPGPRDVQRLGNRPGVARRREQRRFDLQTLLEKSGIRDRDQQAPMSFNVPVHFSMR